MKVCVYGAGAIGGSLAVRLSRAGASVSVVARGAHGQAMRQSCTASLIAGDNRVSAAVHCVTDPAELPKQDLVLVTVKVPALPDIADALVAMTTPSSRIVFVMNGIPWWFGQKLSVPLPDAVFEPLDPGGKLRRTLLIDQIVGGVIYSSNTVIEPGIIRSTSPRNWIFLGKPDGSSDPQLEEIAALLNCAGYDATVTPMIRREIWVKMLMVIGGSTVSALTGCELQPLVNDPPSRKIMDSLMREGAEIGRALGFDLPDDIDERLGYYEDKPGVQPSLLQDFTLGRPVELPSGILAFSAIAVALGKPAPTIHTVATLLRMKAVGAKLDRVAASGLVKPEINA